MNALQKIRFSLSSDLSWFTGRHSSPLSRLVYIIEKYYALLARRKSINYFGHIFEYDNKNTPVTLQAYPPEIGLLDDWIDFSTPRKVLDVGANIGQFSVSLGSIYPKTSIYCFEPNPVIYSLLEKNTAEHKNIRRFNCALGPPGTMDFYYVPGNSAKGSFIKSNASINLGNVETRSIAVELIELGEESCNRLDIPLQFDLVKIDVEGFEYEVLPAIRGIETRFLVMEFSMARAHQYSFYDLLNRITDCFGEIEVLYCDRIDLRDQSRTIGNLLVQIRTPRSRGVGAISA